jgi:hypothetical protein
MKTFAELNLLLLLAAMALTCSTTVSRAEGSPKPDEGHTTKIIRNTEARVDHLAVKLKTRAHKVADKTEAKVDKVASRVKEAGKKADATFKKTADKIGAKLEKITE